MESTYYTALAVAFVRGAALRAQAESLADRAAELPGQAGLPALEDALLQKPLLTLTQAECDTLLAAGQAAGLKLYPFKRTHETLPRVRHVLGVLRSLAPESLLDVGSGRGTFLWPCLNAFPALTVTSVDLLANRVTMLAMVAQGGVSGLKPVQADITVWPGEADAYDVVTLLEVLEHIPDPEAAVRNAVRMARRQIIATVPSVPDQNPEHIHLFSQKSLSSLFMQTGCTRLRISAVPGHWVVVATKE